MECKHSLCHLLRYLFRIRTCLCAVTVLLFCHELISYQLSLLPAMSQSKRTFNLADNLVHVLFRLDRISMLGRLWGTQHTFMQPMLCIYCRVRLYVCPHQHLYFYTYLFVYLPNLLTVSFISLLPACHSVYILYHILRPSGSLMYWTWTVCTWL